ncbi:hypothetical protein IV203_015750 [Nitzschia inconspicua]|uniref:Uncharacterized protein n=1 Tax=Nitzschia inconspicua TaxID=303405 RepID=A0A9K3LE62_9STRA|nr:hypothetical protein IV203_015750 [Nitzschia inconspicua]
MKKARSMTSQHPESGSEEDLGEQLISLFDSYCSLRSRNYKYFLEKHLHSPLKERLLWIWDTTATNPGNRATGAIKAVTKWRVQNNDQSVAELLRTHGPKNGKVKGEVFWIKTNQNVVTRPTDGTPSTKPSILFPDGKLVYDDFCLLGLRERFRERHRQNTCHNTVQAIKHPDFKLKACMVHTGGYNHVAITCEGYTQVYIEAPQSKQVVPSATCIIPLDQHTSQPIYYSKHGNDCVVCVAKAYQQYPGISRREMRQKRLVPKSCFGCPQCKKGKGVSVCKTCWKHFDHELHYMK